jgi:hypothetical protein
MNMKRLIVAALAISAIGVVGSAQAGCTSANRGGSASAFDSASVSVANVTIYNEAYGNAVTGPAYLCSDGSAGRDEKARGKLEIRVNDVVVCSTADALSSDPFGFSSSMVSAASSACGAAISFPGTTSPFGADPDDVNAGAEGADAGARKTVPVKDGGKFWYGGNTYAVPNGTVGYFTRGARAQSDH